MTTPAFNAGFNRGRIFGQNHSTHYAFRIALFFLANPTTSINAATRILGMKHETITRYLAAHEDVTKVIHPSLFEGEQKRRAETYLGGQGGGRYGGLVGFELKGGKAAGRRFIDALKLFYHVANIGDARSLAIHPATTTHSQLSPDEQLATGVSEGYVRLSVGIEHIDDILADLDQALEAAGTTRQAA